MATAGVLLLIYGGGGVLVYGGITTRGGDRLNRTFCRLSRPAEGPAGLLASRSARQRSGWISGHFFGRNKGGVTD